MSRSETLRRTHLRLVESGINPGNLPVGYVPAHPCAVPHPVLAPLVREAIERAAAGGVSAGKLHRLMTAKGLTGKRGEPLSKASFCCLVRNPFYAGYVKYAGSLYPGRHAALVPLALVQEADRQLAGRRKRKQPLRRGVANVSSAQ